MSLHSHRNKPTTLITIISVHQNGAKRRVSKFFIGIFVQVFSYFVFYRKQGLLIVVFSGNYIKNNCISQCNLRLFNQ